jgi:prenyltransferase beta subunit
MHTHPLCILSPQNKTATLQSLQNPTGGFGGGYQQLSHGAPTYAAVLALMIVGTEAAYKAIDRWVVDWGLGRGES